MYCLTQLYCSVCTVWHNYTAVYVLSDTTILQCMYCLTQLYCSVCTVWHNYTAVYVLSDTTILQCMYCLTQLYDGTDMFRIYYIKNNYVFRLTHTTHKAVFLRIVLSAILEIQHNYTHRLSDRLKHYCLNISTRTRTTQRHQKRNI
jgi:hypothetical protein